MKKMKKNKIPQIAISQDLSTNIGILATKINTHKKDLADTLLRFGINIINQAKEQGIEDKDIADFMDSFLENPMTGDHINLMAENYIESKEN